MFSGHKALYFTFSGEGETFFLDGLLRLKLKDYLWYQLHRCGYRYIIFMTVSGGNKIEVFIPDKESFSANKYGQGVFAQKTLWTAKGDETAVKNRITVNRAAASEWLQYKLTEEANTAVVTDIRTLDALFPKTLWDRSGALIQAVRAEKGTLVLTAPMEMSRDELALFVGKDSLFSQLSSRRAVCMPLYEIAMSPQEVPVFEELKRIIPEQVIELGCLSAERLMPMLRQVEFARDENWSSNEFYDILNFLLYWLYNEDLKRDSGGLFENIKGTLTAAKLYDTLIGEGMTALRERIRVQRQVYALKHKDAGENTPLQLMLKERYGAKPQPNAESRVVLDEHILYIVSGMSWPEEYQKCESDFHFVRVEKQDWERMRRDVRKPYNRKLTDARMKRLNRYSDAVRRAQQEHDPETVCRAGNLLMFAASNMYTNAEAQYEDFLKNSETYLQVSKLYFDNERLMRSMEAHGAGQGSSIVYQANYRVLEAKRTEYSQVLQAMDGQLINTGQLPEELPSDLLKITEEIHKQVEEDISAQMNIGMSVPSWTDAGMTDMAGTTASPAAPKEEQPAKMSVEDAMKLLHDEDIV